MKQTMIFIAFFALWMSAMAQVSVTRNLVTTNEGSASLVNTGDKTGVVLIESGTIYHFGKNVANSVQMFPDPPEAVTGTVNGFLYFKPWKLWIAYAGAPWESGVYSYGYSEVTGLWIPDPLKTNGGVQYANQIIVNGAQYLFVSGPLTAAKDISFPNHTFMITEKGEYVDAPNTDGFVSGTQQSGALLISMMQNADMASVQITDMTTGIGKGLPELPVGLSSMGVAYDPFSEKVYTTTWQPYGGNEPRKLLSAKSGDTEWTIELPTIGDPVRLQFQNGFVVAHGGFYDDGTKKSSSALWLYNPVSHEVIDPMINKGWCPINTTFIDCEELGADLIFTAWFLNKAGEDISMAKLQFFPTQKVASNNTVPIKMYPNPASDYLVVEGAEKFTVTNLLGMPVLTSTDQKIDVSNLAPGMYFANGQPFIVTH